MSKVQKKRKYRARFRPRFENGGFWEYYLDLERQFEDFTQYVPYIGKNERVSSFRLVNLLLGVGGYVDSALKEMVTYKGFSQNEECQKLCRKVWENRMRIRESRKPDSISIKQHLKIFEALYGLSHEEVIFRRFSEDEPVVPFRPHNPATKAPEWWDIYNGVKHDFTDSFEEVDLQTTRDALAGAFLLNAIHIPSALKLFEYGVFEVPGLKPGEGWTPDSNRDSLQHILENKQKILGAIVQTSLFVYDYSPEKAKA